MTTYILRGIDADLWRRVKSRAASEGVTLRELLLRWLVLYADVRARDDRMIE